MLTNFQQKIIDTTEAQINTFTAGKGFPLLLLHGYPQTHYIWHKIAPRLVEDFTVIIADLRGYGDSSKPQGKPDHSNYSKRAMARDWVEVMSQLGYEEFYLVGHDRGARVAHRLTLDYPEKVKKLAVLDILPTYDLYQTTDKEFASAYYHWFFLIQPYPLPETLIGANPEYFLRHCLQSWSKDFSAFTPDALAEYIRCFNDPATIHATCEDYRAGATIDLIDDEADLAKKITCPLLVLWGEQGIIGRKCDVLEIWKKKAIAVKGNAINCGHFLAEEAPEETYSAIREFFR
ncbi:MAG: alpha/beta hydrolase [Hydrococcus sp. C42_A2020_068]|uniref:alpha/beta fold hydrolase n=1 Tax=Pleurocapsa sp. PCC 7327 TaxID=118163 RepID=UPI00029FC593|nr:alpha/beta hydrolase [Pleurocapsa sp. PCC 7327]AFY75562.1 putative hydrolase or acyltransferase of alpha/beta superfamily [Pleurocapsa sp. PCC 7327]MBF2022054.1 alpha/beta hydrolase [Hydrococcus sp. C42_A2020_068]